MPAIAHQNKILGNTSGGGSTILVTTSESSLYGQTITLSDGTTTLSGTFSNTGECEFAGVMMTGTLTLACGGVSQSISVPYFGNYSFVFSLFSATVNVTYPYTEGATCTLSDGTTTLIATGSPMAFTVPNAGAWTASVELDGNTKTTTTYITTDGQVASINIVFGTINVTYENDFKGVSITCTLGATTITKTAPTTGNTMSFYPPTTGQWTISGTVGGIPYPTTANVTSLSTPVSVNLETIPNGSTATPTDDIQIWLKCAGIKDKAYTTLAEVLADSVTFNALLGDSNACAYMARSTTWAGVTGGLVPTMTDNTHPQGECIGGSNAYLAFDGNSSTRTYDTALVGYHFTSSVCVTKATYKHSSTTERTIVLKYSDDGITWTTCSDGETVSGDGVEVTLESNVYNSHAYWGISSANDTDTIMPYTIQFYHDGITTSQYAMNLLGQYDTACDALLSDATWTTALNNSSYWYGHIDSGVLIHGGNPTYDSFYRIVDGNHVPVTDPSLLDAGTYTIYSNGLAKAPDNLSNDYGKTIRICPNTKEIVVRPDIAPYWYGFGTEDWEVASTANGWSIDIASNYWGITLTTADTSMSISSPTNKQGSIASKKAITGTYKVIAGAITPYSSYPQVAYQNNDKILKYNSGTSLSGIKQCTANALTTADITGTDKKIVLTTFNNASMVINAVYAE